MLCKATLTTCKRKDDGGGGRRVELEVGERVNTWDGMTHRATNDRVAPHWGLRVRAVEAYNGFLRNERLITRKGKTRVNGRVGYRPRQSWYRGERGSGADR